MKALLVSMPWQMVDCPPLPIGILTACASRCRCAPEIEEYHANLEWCDWLMERSGGDLAPEHYTYVAEVGVWHSVGDWVFAGALYDDPDWRSDVFTAYARDHGLDPARWYEMRALSFGFLDHALETVLASGADVVGFTSTFSQSTASLALAKRIKQRRPEVVTLFGGANCDGPMGAALHRSFSFVDHVVSGEGEAAFVALLDALATGTPLTAVPGLCWRDESGAQRVNPPGPMVPIQQVPRPDYSRWQRAFEASRTGAMVSPQLVLESARGCWWGEKHHCTFCGLNGLAMTFRAKPADVFLDDLAALVSGHRILDVVMVDNIMDHAYFTELLPRLADLDWDLRLRYEVKANLRRDQLAALAAAGIRHVQPGIEHLSSRVLALMDKGVHATQNVQVLRDCDDLGITVDWNFLYGFPGETAEDYEVVIEQLPALVHLQPPSGAVRILLERFSPYFDRPELGFARRRPSAQYDHVYDLPEEVMVDLAYQFDTDPKGIDDALAKKLLGAVRWWQRNHENSTLVMHRTEDGIVIDDRRAGREPAEHVLADRIDRALYEALETPRSVEGLVAVAGAVAAAPVGRHEVTRRIASFRRRGLVLEEGGRIVALATRGQPPRIGLLGKGLARPSASPVPAPVPLPAGVA
ncbi:MAG: RiPP maturation radical SAM C-methyltransferase [Frankiaceae bacterium]